MHNSKTKSTQELEEKLVQDHYGLVISQALAFFEDQYFEDYVQVGLIGLLKAIRRYDYSKSDFASYANICIAAQLTGHESPMIIMLTNQDRMQIDCFHILLYRLPNPRHH